eukprot:gene355-709_t
MGQAWSDHPSSWRYYTHQQFEDGSLFKGQFMHGNRQGEGKMEWSNGDSYDGHWYKSCLDGNGTLRYHDKSVYRGQWAMNKRSGYGVYTFSDGRQYEGEWVKDQPHGKGHVYFPNGSVVTAEFAKGEPVRFTGSSDAALMPGDIPMLKPGSLPNIAGNLNQMGISKPAPGGTLTRNEGVETKTNQERRRGQFKLAEGAKPLLVPDLPALPIPRVRVNKDVVNINKNRKYKSNDTKSILSNLPSPPIPQKRTADQMISVSPPPVPRKRSSSVPNLPPPPIAPRIRTHLDLPSLPIPKVRKKQKEEDRQAEPPGVLPPGSPK